VKNGARQPLPPKTAQMDKPTAAERALADRLLDHINPFSVVDRDRHAVCVARTVLRARGGQA